MNRETKVSSVSIIMCAIACLMSLNAVQAQQPGSSRFGAGTQYTVSTAGSSVPARVPVQAEAPLGRLEKEASRLLPSLAESGAMDRLSAHLQESLTVLHKFSHQQHRRLHLGAVRSGNSSGSKVKPAGGNTASGMAHLSRSSPSQRLELRLRVTLLFLGHPASVIL